MTEGETDGGRDNNVRTAASITQDHLTDLSWAQDLASPAPLMSAGIWELRASLQTAANLLCFP